MLNFSHLKIITRLRMMSVVTLLSIAFLGFVSNYFFQTSKVLGTIINAERVHNNTFHEGIEDFYVSLADGNTAFLDSAVDHVNKADQMAYNMAIIDQLLRLPREKYIDILFETYREAYYNDRDNAYLMANRIKLFLVINKNKIAEMQQIAMNAYQMGEQMKKKMLETHKDRSAANMDYLGSDMLRMRSAQQDFARIIGSIRDFTNTLLFLGLFVIVIAIMLLLWIISVFITRSIIIPVHTMVGNFQVIARGNLNTEIPIHSDNEIGELAASFREIQRGLHDVIEYTKKVAEGDYSQSITPRSDEDELSFALNKMVVKLKESYDRTVQDSWFKSGINRINETLSGDHHLNDMTSNALEFIMNFLHSQLGSIHLYDSEYQFLKLASSSGFDHNKLKERIKLNEGLLGQVAMKKEMTVLTDIPPESYVSFSSSGNYHPKQVIIIPLVFNETLIGVLELSSVNPYTEPEINYLKEAAGIIAINISSAINLVKTNELLRKTQDQASELQVQQEELRVANEELTEHTLVLTENEKRLQVQQEELRVANEELEERTRQLEMQKEDIGNKNKELTDTKDNLEVKAGELQLASQYKSEFLANMSHELRTPLNSLLILSNLLSKNKKGNLTSEQVQSAQIIYKSGTDLLFLINEVLDLSKIEAGKMTLEFGMINSSDIREEILTDFSAIAEDKRLSFEVSIEPGFPVQMETDRYRLMQIIKNLLSNAFKFTKEGKVSVELTMPSESARFNDPELNCTNTCCIRVADTGVGIPDEKLEAIFEAFQQADGSISRRFGGTGLGLSISRGLIKMLGGEIQLESKINKGSTFFIFLPVIQFQKRALEQVNPVAVKAAQITVEKVAVPIIETKEIPWFIDDDRHDAETNRMVMIIHSSKPQAEKFMQQVRAKNYKVIVAATIPDAIILAEMFHPRAIMLAVELANDKRSYHLLKSHQAISKLPIHMINPVEHAGSDEANELKTLETTEFADVLKSLETDFLSLSKKILVVEDDSSTRKIIRDLISELDITIEEAGFAEEAFQILSRDSFDCIILDLGLPDYSGTELLKKLKANHIVIPKVIIYTGREISKDEHRNLNDYTNAIILKGLKSDERLMDEVTLFLHQVSKTIPDHKVKSYSDMEDVLFKGKKILVVDDEIRNVFALGKILEDRDIEVLEAENGEVAIEVLRANKGIDLVLMDVMMPVMDGYEAMRIVRKTAAIQHIPIICLTAKAMKEDYENALKNGANDYLSKPVNEDKLFAMLKIWLYK
jgi:signal transduction histidine kinase/CheY-like chemotaxis protein/HAMP domain-containing protein